LTYQGFNQFEEAIKNYEKSISIKPDYAEAHNNIGIVFKSLGQLDDAIKYYQKAIKINPNFAEAHNNLGNAYRENDALNDAVKCFKQVISINPDLAETHNNLGMALFDLEEFEQAESYFISSIKINPENADSHISMGMIHNVFGRIDEAIKSLKNAIELNANYPVAYTNLCAIYFANQDFHSAIETIKKGKELNPKSNSISLLFEILIPKDASKNKVKIGSNKYLNPDIKLSSNPLVIEREVEPRLIDTLYEMKAIDLNKVRDPSYGNAKGSGYDLFDNNQPILNSLMRDMQRIIKNAIKSDIYIYDSFYTILGAGGGVKPHNHVTKLDKEPAFNLYKQAFSLVYYIDIGDQECNEPGILQLYNPLEKVLPFNGMIIIFPSDRLHSVIYNGNKDRVMIGINFYAL
jgi:tetratricopeptide (TPR) repeat protein